MSLIVENGSGVANANSYITVAQARTYANLRGVELPTSDSKVEALCHQAMDYLATCTYKGVRTNHEQALDWPRKGVVINNYAVADDFIPQNLINAQAALVIEAKSQDLMPSSDGKKIIREKVDSIEVQYSDKSSTEPRPVFTKVDALLKILLADEKSMKGSAVSTLRV